MIGQSVCACQFIGVKSLNKHANMLLSGKPRNKRPDLAQNPSVFLTHLYICFQQWRGIQEANLGPIRSIPTVANT